MKLQIAIDGSTYELDVEVLEEDEAPRYPQFGAYYPMTPVTPTVAVPAVPAAAAEEVGDEAKVCRSPVTGVVIKVNAEPGQEIAENELIMVIEAMKMETNVTAPAAGKVKGVRVAAGDSVKSGQVVVEFE